MIKLSIGLPLCRMKFFNRFDGFWEFYVNGNFACLVINRIYHLELFFVATISNKGTRCKRKLFANEAGKNNHYLIELYACLCNDS